MIIIDYNISKVLKSNLCTGCGTCIALCPTNALKLTINKKNGTYIPKLNENKCTNCGICLKACSGQKIDSDLLNIEIFGKKQNNIMLGNYLNCFVGHANDNEIRHNSSSGGLITQILIFALEEGIIDGALVTRMNKERPLEPEPFIARTKEEIIEARGSKYCPVPSNIGLQEILEAKDGEKFAVVGMPCQIHGVRKAENINRELKSKIKLHLGIFCNHSPNLFATEIYLKRLNVKGNELIKIDYRGKGWPGLMHISQKNNEIQIPLPNYWNFIGTYFFYPIRCFMCSDGICELADISFGDAWLPEYSDDKIGSSIIVSKNEVGAQILNAMELKKVIELNEISDKRVVQSQAGMLYLKKKNFKLFGVPFKVNQASNNLLHSDVIDNLLIFFPYLNSYASSNAFIRKFLHFIPSKLVSLYFMPYNFLISKKAKRDFKKLL